jgi:hypothetical protein
MRYLYHVAVQYESSRGELCYWNGLVVTFKAIESVLHEQVEFDLAEKLKCFPHSIVLHNYALVSESSELPILALLDHACFKCDELAESSLSKGIRDKVSEMSDKIDSFSLKRMLSVANALDRSAKVLGAVDRMISSQAPVMLRANS